MRKEKIFDNSSATTNNKQLEILKTNFPQCFDKNGDFIPHKIEEIVAKDGINLSKESYSLNWLGKSYARLLANEEPLTLLKADTQHNQRQENQNSENLLIKGDNLEVLKHLRHAYSQSIKMIYIDPPYNTGSDGFVYADNRKFTPEQLQRLAGIDEDEAQRILDFTASNSNSHSAWLTFIYPRLYIARELLSDDGVIFISIDDNEQAQLKMLCDEVFGEDNFVADFVWNSTKSITNPALVSVSHTFNLCYVNNISFFDKKNRINFKLPAILTGFANPDNDLRGKWKADPFEAGGIRKNQMYEIKNPMTGKIFTPNEGNCWKNDYDKYLELIKDNRIVFGQNGNGKPQRKRFLYEARERGLTPNTWWDGVGTTTNGTIELKNIFDKSVFSNPKPTKLVKQIVQIGSNKNDTVLDFFAGSGTTADAVMQLNAEDGGNRKCISVQLDEQIDKKKNKTAYDFVKDELKQENPTIFDITKERILRAGKKIQKDNQESKKPKDLSNLDTGFKVFETLPMFEGYLDEADEQENEQITLFDGTQLSDDDLQVLLTSMMVNDGVKLTQKVAEITLDKYTGYYADKKLYLMDKGFTTNDLKTLLEKLDATNGDDKSFQPNKIILFGYNFTSKHQREISEALGSYSNKKQIELDRVVRY